VVSGLGITLFRHNGLPVIILIWILLMVYAPINRIQLVKWFVIVISMNSLFSNVVYPFFTKQTKESNGVTYILLHAISAHVNGKTALNPEEKLLFNQFLPLDQWVYDPCVITLWHRPESDKTVFKGKTVDLIKTLVRLSIANPKVTFQYLRDSSRMIWQIQPGGCYLHRIGVFKSRDGTFNWIAREDLGVQPNSKMPKYASLLYSLYEFTAKIPAVDSIVWRPAIYTYFTLFVVCIWALRARKMRMLLIGIVTLSQTGLMMIINIAQTIRYQYGVMLIGMFSVLLLFLPIKKRNQ